MEDLKELNGFFKGILQRQESICLEFDRDFQETTKKLEKIIFAPLADYEFINDSTDKTPQQIKKRKKPLSTIISTDNEENSMFSNNETEGNTSTRPPRAAKTNLDFKEPKLNTKCRRPSNDSVNYNKKKIKEEQILNVTNTKNGIKNCKTDKQLSDISKKSSIVEQQMEVDENKEHRKILADESIEIVQKNERVVEIADSENEMDIMPPPQTMPLKKNLRNKQHAKLSSSLDDTAVTQSEVEKLSLVNGTTEIKMCNSLKEPRVKIEKLSLELIEKTKQLQISENEQLQTTKSKKKPGRKGRRPLPKPIKEERFSSEIVDVDISSSKRITRSNRNASNATTSEKNISLESVYEDAIPTGDCLQPPQSTITTKQNPITNNTKKLANEKTRLENGHSLSSNNNYGKTSIDDATFISAKDVDHNKAVSLADATFVTQSNLIAAQSTFIMPENQNINNATMIMNETQCLNGAIAESDMTFNVLPGKSDDNKNITVVVRDSLMTDDDSDMEVPIKYIPRLKTHLNKKELFNPCVQSPVKKKVEAFEKEAFNNINSPIPQRQTRTKTRAKQAKENCQPDIQENTEQNLMEIVKPKLIKEKLITPLIGRQIGRLLTPSQPSYTTPGIGGIIKKQPSSTSKVIGIQKTLQSAVTKTSLIPTNRTPSQSRENSVEDLKRYGLKLQEQIEERKKKRELKQQQVQQVRERKEKERADNLKRIMEERDEKARRKATEADQKRQLDEINRQLKLQEEKREQQKRIEKQKQLEREAAEIARKEREMLENLKIQKAKEKMQLKYDQNKKQLQQKKPNNNNGPKYDFDMLQSDDSTDDETVEKTNRPPVPEWSKPSNRKILLEQQAEVPTKIIDSFFSVQPLTPDLTDIFPSIHPKYLKRNSSVIWKTPPRYSQLPKKK